MRREDGRLEIGGNSPGSITKPCKHKSKKTSKQKKPMKSAVRAVVGSSWPEAWAQAISFSGRGSYRGKEEGKSGRRIILINTEVNQARASICYRMVEGHLERTATKDKGS